MAFLGPQWRLVHYALAGGHCNRLRRTIHLLLPLLIASCTVKVETPVPAEFASGISYTNYVVRRLPWSIHVARVKRATSGLDFRSIHAGGAVLALRTLSEQIKALPPELGTPVVAMNGDFFVREKAYAGDPRGLQIVEGELLSAPIGGIAFWIDSSGVPHATNVQSLFKVTWPAGQTTRIGFNEERRTSTNVVLYTPALGPSTRTTNGVELILESAGEGPWLPLRAGTTYSARIKEVSSRGNTPLDSNTMVLSFGWGLVRTLPKFKLGTILKISTDTDPVLADVRNALGGGPVLIHDGMRQKWTPPPGEGLLPYATRSMRQRHPRTALGWDDEYFYLVEVDGRQRRLSVGMTLNELADFMIGLGCKEAVNFDGGGSSMFWCNGRIVNSPCEKKERPIANALVVLRKPGVQQEAVVSRFEPRPPSPQ